MMRLDASSLEESPMKVLFSPRNATVLVLLTLLAATGLLSGCLDNLCTKRLYLYRDTKIKGLPPADMALLIADPAIVTALLPEAAPKVTRGLPWAPEQPFYDSDYYQLSIDALDGRLVYQGLCMNITPTYVCEVWPGSRRVLARLKLFGPWGRERLEDNASLNLKPGRVYFLHPDWDAASASHKTLRLKAERLPASYNAALRLKLMDWLRLHTTGRSLED
jgi:hypothetical protein